MGRGGSNRGFLFRKAKNVTPETGLIATSENDSSLTSTSKKQHGVVSNSTVHRLLDCPVCMDTMYFPIHQCPNGHTLCSKCKSRVRYCPICRHELGNIRCLALEKVAESVELPCKYQSLGCQDVLPFHTRLRHAEKCRFRPFDCPYAGRMCHISGNIPFLVDHLKNAHMVDMHEGCTFNHRYVKPDVEDPENAIWMLTVFNCYGHHFCLHFEAFNLSTTPVYIAFIRFMGSEEDAKKFSYSLESGGNGRKITWQGVPRSIRDSHTKVRDSLDGLIIHRSMALVFAEGNERLKLKVTGQIWKAQL